MTAYAANELSIAPESQLTAHAPSTVLPFYEQYYGSGDPMPCVMHSNEIMPGCL